MATTTRTLTVIGVLLLSSLALVPSSSASTVTYTNLDFIVVPDGSGAIADPVEVDPGRPPVQSLEVANLQPVWAANGTDFSTWLVDPSGDRLDLMTVGCSFFPGGTHFTVTDNAPFYADGSGGHGFEFCSTQLENGIGKPHNDSGQTLAQTFDGKPAGGTWTLYVRDSGELSGGGTFDGWALRITHEPVTMKAPRKVKVKGRGTSLRLKIRANADCTIESGGASKPRAYGLTQGTGRRIHIVLTSKGRRSLERRGKAKLALDAITPYGDTQHKVIRIQRKS